jgi:hypothetical protein
VGAHELPAALMPVQAHVHAIGAHVLELGNLGKSGTRGFSKRFRTSVQDFLPRGGEESLLQNFLPFLQEPKLIFAELAEAIFISHRTGN